MIGELSPRQEIPERKESDNWNFLSNKKERRDNPGDSSKLFSPSHTSGPFFEKQTKNRSRLDEVKQQINLHS